MSSYSYYSIVKIVKQLLPYFLSSQILLANTLKIPDEYPTIQVGIDSAQHGDTVLIANGTYFERLIISDKSIILASNYLLTQNQDDITETIIDGNEGNYVLLIDSTAGTKTSIIGLTIQNGNDGISPYTHFNISNSIITNCTDGIDYETGSGGICENNIFKNNEDDGIDLDYEVDIIIENNKIYNNSDDGIEVRLQPYSGPVLNIIIQNNIIANNGEDGIQLIGYDGHSNRVLHIENNLIVNNDMVGLGCMGDGNTTENYEGAAIQETIYLICNTFSDNNYSVTGGANLIAFNNIVAHSTTTGMKNVNGGSLISYSAFWNNSQDFENCITDSSTLVFGDPAFIGGGDYHIQDTSSCIEKGNSSGSPPTDIEYTLRGNPPDIGAYENTSDEIPLSLGEIKSSINYNFKLSQNYPNPFNPNTTIEYQLPKSSYVTLNVYSLNGHVISSLVSKNQSAGYYEVEWDASDFSSGVYFYRLETNTGFIKTKKLILMK